MKKVICYLRVSTKEQGIDGYSIEAQKERLLAFCKAKGWIVIDIIIDIGYSGSSLNRPGMQLLIEAAENKKSDLILVYKLDRLSRSQKDTLYLIEDLFLPNNVDFVSISENFDTSTPFGRAMIGILSVFAQLEREQIKERFMMGRNERARNGLWHGGGTDPIGYDYVDGALKINPIEAEQVRLVFEMYASGASLAHISEHMDKRGYKHKHGNWSYAATLGNVLDNELYTGTVHFEDARAENAHSAIVSKSLFGKVKAIRDRNRKTYYKQYNSQHLLTGMIYCERCGARYFAKKDRTGKHYYSCYSRAKSNKKMVKDANCKNKIWTAAALEKAVEDILFYLANNPMEFNKLTKKKKAATNSSPETNKNELENINAEISRLMDLYQYDQVPVGEIAVRIEELHDHKMKIMDRVPVGNSLNFDFEGAKLLMKDIPSIWDISDIAHKRHVLQQLINRINLDGDDILVNWSFSGEGI